MNKEDLQKILDEHKLWLDTDGEEGSRADLRRADLRRADLREANLYGADLPKNTWAIYGEPYFIFIHGDNIRAGCECHDKDKWLNFSDEEVEEMNGQKALDFYPRLLEIIDFYCGGKI